MSARRGLGESRPSYALVVFSGRAHLRWLRMLKPGFRHCFVVLRFPHRWMIVNPLCHRTEVAEYGDLPPDVVAGHFAALGMRLLATRIGSPDPRPAPWRPFTCVEAAKRILGIAAPSVWTPWQLYRHILIQQKFLDIGK